MDLYCIQLVLLTKKNMKTNHKSLKINKNKIITGMTLLKKYNSKEECYAT